MTHRWYMHRASRDRPPAGCRDAWCCLGGGRRVVVLAAMAASLCIAALAGRQHHSAVVGFAMAAVGLASTAAATIDVVTRRLPNSWVATAAFATLCLALSSGTQSPGADDIDGLSRASAGALIAIAVVTCARMVRIDGVGGGDVKLATVIGAGVGIASPTIAGVAMVVASASCLLSTIVTRSRAVAFGPSLWLGWLVAESFAILTGGVFQPRSVHLYSRCCVASAELLRRGFVLGGGI